MEGKIGVDNKKEVAIKVDNWIANKFQNAVFIIDEAHHSKSKFKEIIRILQHSRNTHLLLLSATPMFDRATDIIYLINYMIMNDVKNLKKYEKDSLDNDIFRNEVLTSSGKEKFVNAIKGRVSFLRSNNPLRFPFRLYPSSNLLKDSDLPKYDFKGKNVNKKMDISDLNLFYSTMNKSHSDSYLILTSKIQIDDDDNDNYEDFDEETAEDENNEKANKSHKGLLPLNKISNACWNLEDETPRNPTDVSKWIGIEGIRQFADYDDKDGIYRLNDKYKGDNMPFKLDNLEKYAPKIANIVKSIQSSTGLVLVYSFYIRYGADLVALALEANGFRREGTKMLANYTVDNSKPQKVYAYMRPPQNKKLDDEIINMINGEDAKDCDKEGSNQIKVLIITSRYGEGIDLRRIREVHILEPWFHFNKMEQVIGRAIRNCSHKDLDFKFRNTTVYFHVNMLSYNKDHKSNKNRMSVDLYIYLQFCMNKMKTVADIEHLLAKYAFDCDFTKNTNIIASDLNKQFKIVDSQGGTRSYTPGYQPKSRECFLREDCNIACDSALDTKDIESDVNLDTYRLASSEETIQEYIDILLELYGLKGNSILSMEDIIFELENYQSKKFTKFDKLNVYQALNKMIKEKINIQNIDDRGGYLIFDKGYYIYRPEEYEQLNFSIRKNNVPRVYSRYSVPISELLDYRFVDYSEGVEESTISIEKVIEKINDYIEFHIDLFKQYFGFKNVNYLDAICNSAVESSHTFKFAGKMGKKLVEPITNEERTYLLIAYYKSGASTLEKINSAFLEHVSSALDKFIVTDESGISMVVDVVGKSDVRYYDFETDDWFDSKNVFLAAEKERILQNEFDIFKRVENPGFIEKEGSTNMLKYADASKNKIDFGRRCKDIAPATKVINYINPMLDFMVENDIISVEEAEESKLKVDKRSNINNRSNTNLPKEGICKMIEILFRIITNLKIKGNNTYHFFNLYDTILIDKIVKDQKKK